MGEKKQRRGVEDEHRGDITREIKSGEQTATYRLCNSLLKKKASARSAVRPHLVLCCNDGAVQHTRGHTKRLGDV